MTEFIYCSKDILNDPAAIEETLVHGIVECGLTLKKIESYQFDPIGVTSIAIIGESHIAIHTYPEASHASLDIFICSTAARGAMKLLDYLKEAFGPKIVKSVEVSRGNPLEVKDSNWIASSSTSPIEARYQVKTKILSKMTDYQMVDIIENDSFGRMLFLDKDLQIAEKDAYKYNANLVSPLIREQSDIDEVAILGGGDGGVLQELLKYDPKKVVLVDIDKEVIDISKKYLPNICKGAFDDPRVKVIIGDAGRFLEETHSFDAIIYDLTMHPEAFIKTDRETYLNDLSSKIRKNLKRGGMVTMQCCSEFDSETYDLLHRILPGHFEDVEFIHSFIPSFCENWVFAKARVE